MEPRSEAELIAATRCARPTSPFHCLLQVLVPTVVGKLLRSFSQRVRTFVAAHKTGLSIFSHVNLALIIWQNLRYHAAQYAKRRGFEWRQTRHTHTFIAVKLCRTAAASTQHALQSAVLYSEAC
jgi:hypothetical protein